VAATASWLSRPKTTTTGHSRTGDNRKATNRRTFGGHRTAMLGNVGIISRA
jgi:hypothetical protein